MLSVPPQKTHSLSLSTTFFLTFPSFLPPPSPRYDEDETVRVVMSGNQEPKSVDVTQEAIDAGTEELNKRVTAAMRDAHAKSVTVSALPFAWCTVGGGSPRTPPRAPLNTPAPPFPCARWLLSLSGHEGKDARPGKEAGHPQPCRIGHVNLEPTLATHHRIAHPQTASCTPLDLALGCSMPYPSRTASTSTASDSIPSLSGAVLGM